MALPTIRFCIWIGALVGVERFAIVEEASDLVVGDDAVAAEQSPGPMPPSRGTSMW